MITQITDAYVRLYTDSGQITAYVEWIDSRGKPGRTEGNHDSRHMTALLDRAKREGVQVRRERW